MNQNILEEQKLIHMFYNIMNNNDNEFDEKYMNELIQKINTKHNNSYILSYYIGLYYDRINLYNLAEEHFNKSIKIQPLFTPPYFELSNILISKNEFSKSEKLLKYIFDEETLNPFSEKGDLRYNFMDDLRIITILIPEYIKQKDYDNMEYLIKRILPKFKNIDKKNLEYRYLEVWKNLQNTYGCLLIDKYFDHKKAYEQFYLGLEGLCEYKYTQKIDFDNNLHNLDKLLFRNLQTTNNYIQLIEEKKLTFDINDLYSRYRIKEPKNNFSKDKLIQNNKLVRKIRIGYISPDFNKNAVGLFVTPLLKYYDKDKFEVFIYYNNKIFDEFTKVFKTYISLDNWINISNIGINEVYNLIKNIHKIDILVDLIAIGTGNSLELIVKKPAPIIINYLGYPDLAGIKEYDYRIVDRITDPFVSNNISKEYENLLYHPKCFICYSLFENIKMPIINYKNKDKDKDDEFIYLGVMNKVSKHSDIIRNIWLSILLKNKNYILCIKITEKINQIDVEELYKEFPQSQLRFLPFTETLDEFFEQFNELDFCIDTYPYSGTTTTCSSLLMGVPVFTIYNSLQNNHVSNVSASINIFSEQNDMTICKNLNDYKNKILDYKVNKSIENEERIKRRKKFLNCMNPIEFMKNYEGMLYELIDKKA